MRVTKLPKKLGCTNTPKHAWVLPLQLWTGLMNNVPQRCLCHRQPSFDPLGTCTCAHMPVFLWAAYGISTSNEAWSPIWETGREINIIDLVWSLAPLSRRWGLFGPALVSCPRTGSATGKGHSWADEHMWDSLQRTFKQKTQLEWDLPDWDAAPLWREGLQRNIQQW